MRLEADLHIHTVASGHAFSTVREVVQAAREKKLKGIALLDHGPAVPGGAHEYYFSNLIVLPDYIEGVRVFKGAEANIVDERGSLDISDYTLQLLEFVGVSFHPDCGYEAQDVVKNTEVLLRALENPHVAMICHPCVPGFELDIREIVRAAAEKNVLIEINNFSFHNLSFRAPAMEDNIRLLEVCAEENCPVAVNSDAHYHDLVGDVSLAERVIKEMDFPQELIVNTDLKKVFSFVYSFDAKGWSR